MDNQNIVIRSETANDRRAVENLVREAFWNVYRLGCFEHFVLHKLRDDSAFVPELDFVMEKEGILIGQNVFMRARIQIRRRRGNPYYDNGADLRRAGMPAAGLRETSAGLFAGKRRRSSAIPRYALRGILTSMERAALPMPARSAFVIMDCRKGGRVLFPVQGVGSGIPERRQRRIRAAGRIFCCGAGAPEAFERFDAQFPPKEKLKLPGQIF